MPRPVNYSRRTVSPYFSWVRPKRAALFSINRAHITGTDRAQVLLLPDTVDDYVGPDNPVRFIDAFVDSLDLAGAGFERAEPKETGRPGYDPSDLLKLYIYGYLNRVRSSRRLEAETHRNLEVIWLLRRLRPNCKTIADFRRENREAFRQVFRDFVKVCRSLELFDRELIAVDGTRIKAVNSRDRKTSPGPSCGAIWRRARPAAVQLALRAGKKASRP